MKDVVTTSAVFFNYALLAVFAQNAVFTRALGVSRLVQLVGDDRTSSWLFGMLLVTEARHRLRSKAIPEAFRGLPITLVYIGVLALAIYGFTGHSVIL